MVIEGQDRLLEKPEFDDAGHVRHLVTALDARKKLVRLLDLAMKNRRASRRRRGGRRARRRAGHRRGALHGLRPCRRHGRGHRTDANGLPACPASGRRDRKRDERVHGSERRKGRRVHGDPSPARSTSGLGRGVIGCEPSCVLLRRTCLALKRPIPPSIARSRSFWRARSRPLFDGASPSSKETHRARARSSSPAVCSNSWVGRKPPSKGSSSLWPIHRRRKPAARRRGDRQTYVPSAST